jgi:hypothetical protein
MTKGIVIRNQEEQMMVETLTLAHDALNKELGVNTTLSFQRECNWGKDARHAGLYYGRTKEIKLNFRNMYGATLSQLLEVLGHEMRHAVQDLNGWHMLSTDGKGKGKNPMISGSWKGQHMWVRYMDAPWEVDARDFEKPYAELAVKLLNLTTEQCAVQLPFGTLNETDKNATYDKVKSIHPNAIFLASGWVTDSKRKKSGLAYVLPSDLPEGFNFKKREDSNWLVENQQLIRVEPHVKIEKQWGGFSVREMVS